MKYLLLFFFLIGNSIINAQLQSEDGFYLITSNDAGDVYSVKTEKSDRSFVDNKIQFVEYWVKIERASKKIKGKDGKIRNVEGNKVLQYFSCSCTDKMLRLEESHEYNSKGKMLKSSIYPETVKSYSKAIPGSYGETLLKAVCGIIE